MSVTKTFFLFTLTFLALSACSHSNIQTDKSYEDKNKTDLYKNGSLVSDQGGFEFFGKDNAKSTSRGMLVNAYLWRASLDTLSFMPIATADPFGGVITTDWYILPDNTDERTKINVFILDRELRADGLRLSVFKQKKSEENGDWLDEKVDPSVASALEETILMRARQIRLLQKNGK